MNPIVILVAIIFFVAEVNSSAADPELERLKASYDTAVERAITPIKATYEKELRKLLERQTKAGNLAVANEINAELESLNGKAAGSSPEDKPTSTKSIERFFVNKTWMTTGGTSFTFQKVGAGYRQDKNVKTALIWRLTDNDIVEATAEVPSEGKTRNTYFRFVSAIEAYYGDSSDVIKGKLDLKR